MNTLNNENIIYVPNTLDGENIVSSHLEENALLLDGTNQMLADLNVGNHRLTHVSNATISTDAVNKSQLDLKADTTYVDTNFLNKTTTTSQNVASKLTFTNVTTDILINPVISLKNAINTSSNGMFLHFYKNLINQPNLQIGGLVWLDIAPSLALRRACEMVVSNDINSLPVFNIKFSSGVFNPLTINNLQTILRNDEFFIKNKTTSQNVLTYLNSSDKWTMYKPLDMNATNNIINLADPVSAQDASTKNYTDTQSANTNYLKRDGSLAMTGNLQMGSNNISIGTNKQISFNNSDLSTADGMIMNYDGGIGFLDVRGTEFRIRTNSVATPSSIKFKVNDTNTTVINNFFVDGNTTLGNENTDTATFNCKTTLYNTLTFANGSRTDKARIHLIKSDNTSYTMDNTNLENGVLCNNTSTISITMPAKHIDWNNRSYFVKTQTATVNLVQNTGTSIDNDNTTLVMSSNYRGYLLQFDSDYDFNGNIWRLCQI